MYTNTIQMKLTTVHITNYRTKVWQKTVTWRSPNWQLPPYKRDKQYRYSTWRVVGHLLRPDIVHFHFTCLGNEIFLRELTLSNMLSSNPNSFLRYPQFSHKVLFYYSSSARVIVSVDFLYLRSRYYAIVRVSGWHQSATSLQIYDDVIVHQLATSLDIQCCTKIIQDGG
jgi:hypothetical protein